VNLFSQLPKKENAVDLLFADRISYSVFKTGVYNELGPGEKRKTATEFYKDAYSFNQKGCSCPQAIFLVGNADENRRFEKEFYDELTAIVDAKYETDVYSLSSLKINRMAADAAESRINGVEAGDMRVVFTHLEAQTSVTETSGGGMFYTRKLDSIRELLPYVNKKIQTLGYFGFTTAEMDECRKLISGKGIDRIVPVGQALNFHYRWDGYQLLESLCNLQ